jgi:hypothetical protein
VGVGYILVNHTRRERLLFTHIAASTKYELAGNPVAAAITSWYLLEHASDHIAFVSDSDYDWPFPTGSRSDLATYQDMTDAVVEDLVKAGIVRDEGREVFFDDPDAYVRLLRNIWLENLPALEARTQNP